MVKQPTENRGQRDGETSCSGKVRSCRKSYHSVHERRQFASFCIQFASKLKGNVFLAEYDDFLHRRSKICWQGEVFSSYQLGFGRITVLAKAKFLFYITLKITIKRKKITTELFRNI